MRVLLTTSFPIPGEYDGTAMLPIKILRALKPRGVDVAVAYLRARPPWQASDPPVGLRGHPGLRAAGLELGLRSRARPDRRERPFDLVHAQHYGGATRALNACRRQRLADGLRDPLAAGRGGRARPPGPGAGLPGYLSMEQKVLRHAAAIIALGEPVRDVVIREKHVPADRVSVIYPGIDLARIRDAPGRPRRSRASAPSTRSSCTSAASCTPTRGYRS